MPTIELKDKHKFEVDPVSDCWNWKLKLDHDGYGRSIYDKKHVHAHRYFYLKYIGEVPKNYVIDHLCRNRKCVNLAHLEPIPTRENTRRGNTAKLTINDVLKIRSLPMTHVEIAKIYNVNQSTVTRIINKKRWEVL